jgi:hypothetical protein
MEDEYSDSNSGSSSDISSSLMGSLCVLDLAIELDLAHEHNLHPGGLTALSSISFEGPFTPSAAEKGCVPRWEAGYRDLDTRYVVRGEKEDHVSKLRISLRWGGASGSEEQSSRFQNFR